jgi:hypothetical protein
VYSINPIYKQKSLKKIKKTIKIGNWTEYGHVRASKLDQVAIVPGPLPRARLNVAPPPWDATFST